VRASVAIDVARSATTGHGNGGRVYPGPNLLKPFNALLVLGRESGPLRLKSHHTHIQADRKRVASWYSLPSYQIMFKKSVMAASI
jgi:hypothetical protein